MKRVNLKIILFSFFVSFVGCENSNNVTPPTNSNFINVPSDFASLTEAVINASGAATIRVAPGTYSPSTTGESFPIQVPDNMTIEGTGNVENVIVNAEGTGGVFSIDSSQGVVLEGLTIRGGETDRGGGVFINNASATLRNNVIRNNHATVNGNAIQIAGDGTVVIENNVIDENTTSASTPGADPHTIRILDANPSLINNTIVFGDGNGIIINGASNATIVNNIIAFNGRALPTPRGRGICDFSTANPNISFNLFFGNQVAAILTSEGDMTASAANDVSLADGTFSNLDGDPMFMDVENDDFSLNPASPAIHAGDPNSIYNNDDGTRNTIGHTGGPDGF